MDTAMFVTRTEDNHEYERFSDDGCPNDPPTEFLHEEEEERGAEEAA
jgi:hypothetical protein